MPLWHSFQTASMPGCDRMTARESMLAASSSMSDGWARLWTCRRSIVMFANCVLTGIFLRMVIYHVLRSMLGTNAASPSVGQWGPKTLRPCGPAALRTCGPAALRPCGLAVLRPRGGEAAGPPGHGVVGPCGRGFVGPWGHRAMGPWGHGAIGHEVRGAGP